MRVLVLALLCGVWSLGGELPKNWTGPYPPCTASLELLKYKSMNLGVRLATSNPDLAAQFQSALNFWATVIDMRWHVERTSLCAVELLDGESQLFLDSTVAKSHLAERSGFQGWIAFNSKAPLTRGELFLTAVHEIGHLLGLSHNPDTDSVMYYTNREESDLLDAADLLSLAAHHSLRPNVRGAPIRCVNSDLNGAPSLAAFNSFRRRLFSIIH
jgi:hypothetical protein